MKTNGSVAGESELIIQILKRRSFEWALIPLLLHFLSDNVLDGGADQVQMVLGSSWTEDGCGCWDAVEL